MKKRTAYAARTSALSDVAKLIVQNINAGGPTSFAFLSNPYASEAEKKEYRRYLWNLAVSLDVRSEQYFDKLTVMPLDSGEHL